VADGVSTVLVDQDGVIADWGLQWDESLDEFGEPAAGIPRHAEQKSFNIKSGLTRHQRRIVDTIFDDPYFYRDLKPIPGSRTALRQMLKAGHDVRIVTSPWVSNPRCASDKINWVRRYYGNEWAHRVIVTTDKTFVRGDILIDDRPQVTGAHTPTWEHVLFTQPYNADPLYTQRRINAWPEWQQIIGD
jgi:5'-nucleotidase